MIVSHSLYHCNPIKKYCFKHRYLLSCKILTSISSYNTTKYEGNFKTREITSLSTLIYELKKVKTLGDIEMAKYIIVEHVKDELLTPDSFYLSLICLKNDIEAFIQLYDRSMSSSLNRNILTPESVTLLLKSLLSANKLEQALSIYEQAFEESIDLSVDVIIINIVLKILSAIQPVSDKIAYETVNFLNKLIYINGIMPHHSTFSIAFGIVTSLPQSTESLDLLGKLETLMKVCGIKHSNATIGSILQSCAKVDNYDLLFKTYNEGLTLRMLPSTLIMCVVIDTLIKLQEYAIGIRILYSWLLCCGRLDWNLIEVSSKLLYNGVKPSSRYNPNLSKLKQQYVEGKQQLEAQAQQQSQSKYQMISKEKSSDNMNQVSHLDWLNRMKIDMNGKFNENLRILPDIRSYVIDVITRLVMNRLESSTSSSSNSHPRHDLHQEQEENNNHHHHQQQHYNQRLTPYNPIATSVLYTLSHHIAYFGGLDNLITTLILRNSYDPKRFWTDIFFKLSIEYKYEYRIFLHVWERVRHDPILSNDVKTECFGYLVMSLLRNGLFSMTEDATIAHFQTISMNDSNNNNNTDNDMDNINDVDRKIKFSNHLQSMVMNGEEDVLLTKLCNKLGFPKAVTKRKWAKSRNTLQDKKSTSKEEKNE